MTVSLCPSHISLHPMHNRINLCESNYHPVSPSSQLAARRSHRQKKKHLAQLPPHCTSPFRPLKTDLHDANLLLSCARDGCRRFSPSVPSYTPPESPRSSGRTSAPVPRNASRFSAPPPCVRCESAPILAQNLHMLRQRRFGQRRAAHPQKGRAVLGAIRTGQFQHDLNAHRIRQRMQNALHRDLIDAGMVKRPREFIFWRFLT